MHLNRNPKIGDKVIMRDNEEGPFLIGIVTRFDKLGSLDVPIVKINEEEFCCLGFILVYSQELENWLSSIPPERQWGALVEKRDEQFSIIPEPPEFKKRFFEQIDRIRDEINDLCNAGLKP